MTDRSAIHTALAMMASAIKSGEGWSLTLQNALDEAKAALALPAAAGPISMTDLLNAIGDDNIGFQTLDQSVRDLDWSAKRGTTIVSFETETTISVDTGLDKYGMVIWLDRDLVHTTMARLRAERDRP